MTDLITNFHFLRPEFLLGIPLLLALWWGMRKKIHGNSSWDQVLPAEFLQALAPQFKAKKIRNTHWIWPILFGLSILALAGPTWDRLETPTGLKEDPVVIVFDLSLSMLSTDQSPNRLKRTQQKLYDLIERRSEGQTGLVVFAGSSHVVSPLTEDSATLKAMIPALDPFIMPDLGSDAYAGVNKAVEVLQQAGSQGGRILLFADGIEQADLSMIVERVKGAGATLSVIGVGTPDGGPIPIPNRGFIKQNDEIVVAKPNFADMESLARETGGSFSLMTLDNRDLQITLPDRELLLTKESDQQTGLDWHDSGYWLLLLIVPLVLWQYRQTGLTLLVLLVVMSPRPSHAFEWNDLWQTPNQQGQIAYQREDYEQAREKFQDPMWKGMAQYRAGDYAQAAETFAEIDTSDAQFNRGNALIEQQQFEEALKAYDRALELNPDNTAARANKEKLEKFLKDQQQPSSQQNQQSKQGQNQDQKQGSEGDQQQQSQEGQQSQDSSQNQSQSSGQSQNAQTQPQPGQQDQNQSATRQQAGQGQEQQDQQNQPAQAANQSDEPPEGDQGEAQQVAQQPMPDDEQSQEEAEGQAAASVLSDQATLQDQQTEQWLRRIPDDPGGLLRRKFLQQYQSGSANRSQDSGGRTIW